jgi:hypothetical protein
MDGKEKLERIKDYTFISIRTQGFAATTCDQSGERESAMRLRERSTLSLEPCLQPLFCIQLRIFITCYIKENKWNAL